MCQLLNDAGFAGLYDFLYLPVNFKTWRFFRYCLVNFTCHQAAASALEKLGAQGDVWAESTRDEAAPCPDWCAKSQGLAAHLEQYRDSPVMHPSVPDQYKPILLRNGVRVAFPPATVPLVAPNARKFER